MVGLGPSNHDPDWAIRIGAFSAVKRLALSTGGRIPWAKIAKGFRHGDDLAFERRAPLVYFRATETATYEAIWPVWVEQFQANHGRVLLAAADPADFNISSVQTNQSNAERARSYSLRSSKHRNHQAWFSSRIRSAYGYRCAFSGLPMQELLVGAHIRADEHGGPASVSNGICISTLHHAAFDAHLIGVDPDLRVHVSPNVLDTDDGPLLASLQTLNGALLRVPQDPLARPDPEFLVYCLIK